MHKAARLLGALDGHRQAAELRQMDRRHARETRRASRRSGPPSWREPLRWVKVWWQAIVVDWQQSKQAGREKALGNEPRSWTCERGTRGCTETHWSGTSRRPWDRIHDRCVPLFNQGMKKLSDV